MKNQTVILIHKIDFAIKEIIYSSLIAKIRKEKRAKAERFKFREDALRSISGELLFRYVMEKYYNIEYENEIITDNEYGKPYLKNKKLFFNISHSGNWAVIACHNDDAGIDIEKIENPPYEIMPANFTPDEIGQIENKNSQVKTVQFYKMWALKESYIKMKGKGLSIPLESFSIDIGDENKIDVKDRNCKTDDIYFKMFRPDADHIAAVCLRNYNKDILPRLVSLSELLL